MNKSKVFTYVFVLVLIVIVLCGCNHHAPSVDATLSEASDEILTEVPQSDLELEILTVPQDETTPQSFTEETQESTEAETESAISTETNSEGTKSTEAEPNEDQKIELPFVPAN